MSLCCQLYAAATRTYMYVYMFLLILYYCSNRIVTTSLRLHRRSIDLVAPIKCQLAVCRLTLCVRWCVPNILRFVMAACIRQWMMLICFDRVLNKSKKKVLCICYLAFDIEGIRRCMSYVYTGLWQLTSMLIKRCSGSNVINTKTWVESFYPFYVMTYLANINIK